MAADTLYCIEFNIFSYSSWKKLFQNSGILGWAFVAISLSGKFFDVRTSENVLSGSFSGSMIFRVFCLFIALMILIKEFNVVRVPQLLGFKCILGYGFVCFFSTIWSVAPVVTFGKSIEILVAVLLVVVASSKQDAKIVLSSIANIIVYLLAIQIIFILLCGLFAIPGFVERSAGGLAKLFSNRLVSPFMSANSIGYSSSLILVFLIAFKKNIRFFYFYFVIFLASLLMSTSRTSFFILILSFIFVNLRRLNFALLGFIFFGLVFIVNSTFSIDTEIIHLVQGTQTLENTLSLSGRTVLWESALSHIFDNFFFGNGFGVGSRYVFSQDLLKGFEQTISTVHNGFLEVFLGVGAFGFIFFIFSIMYILFVYFLYKGKNLFLHQILNLLPALLICSVMSVGIGGACSEIFILFVMIVAYHDLLGSCRNFKYYNIKW